MPFTVGQLIATLRLDSAQFDAQIRRAQGELTGAAGSAERMAGATDTAAGALAGAGRQAGVASAQTAKLRAAQLTATAAQERYNTVLADTAATRGRLASSEASMIRANQRVAATEREIAQGAAAAKTELAAVNTESRAAAGVATRAGTAFGGFARMAAGLGVALGGFELIKKAIDIGKQASVFQSSMTRIHTVIGVNTAEVNQMSAALLKMSGPLATAPDELATSLYHMKAIGLPAAQALDAVRVAAEGAKIGNANLEETTNALTSTIASGITKGQSFSKTMSELLTIVGTGDMKLSDFNESLATGGLSRLKQYGVDLTDFGAAMAVFGDNNIRGRNGVQALIQSVQSMAVVAPKGQAELAKLGISSDQLAKDLQSGGLNKAITDLREHLRAAGITSKETGQILTEIFTKRAGAGLSILIDQSGRLAQKYDDLNHGALTFGQRWTAVTHTTAFAFQKIGAQFESAGITLASKLTPAVSSAVNWLGTSLPHALSVLGDILAPTAKLVGTTFVGAWRGALAVLGPVSSALGTVGHLLSEHSGLVSDVITPVLAMWAAWKGYTIVMAAGRAIGMALSNIEALSARSLLAVRGYGQGVAATFAGNASASERGALVIIANNAKVEASAAEDAAATDRAAAVKARAFARMIESSDASSAAQVAAARRSATAAEEQALATAAAAAETSAAADTAAADVAAAGAVASIGWKAVLGPLALAATAVAVLTTMLGHNSSAAQANAQEVDSLTAAIKADSGALGENANAQVRQTLLQQGALAAARELGVNLGDVTAAALGNSAALGRVTSAVHANAKGTDARVIAGKVLLSVLGNESGAVKNATLNAKLEAAAGKGAGKAATANATAHKALASAMHWVVDENGNLLESTAKVAGVSDAATKALQAQTVASNALKTAEDLLNGVNESVETSTDSLSIALGNLANGQALATDKNGHAIRSLNQSTVAGATNRQMLVGLIDAAKAQAQATADQAAKTHTFGQSLIIGNTQLGKNEDAIRKAAAAAGLNKQQVDNLIASMGILSKVHAAPKVDVNTTTATAKTNDVFSRLHMLNVSRANATVGVNDDASGPLDRILGIMRIIGQGVNATIHVNTPTGVHQLKASGGTITGAGGPKSDSQPAMLSPGEEVIQNPYAGRYRGLLKAINAGHKIPGYASGGTAGAKDLGSVSGGFSSFWASLTGTASSSRPTFWTLLRAAEAAGLNGSMAAVLRRQDLQLNAMLSSRTGLLSSLARATSALQAVQQKYNQENAAVQSATRGGFDITSAGQGANGGPVTGGSIMAQQAQARNTIARWSAGLKKLGGGVFGKSGAGRRYLSELFAAGPSTLPQVLALESLSLSQDRQLIATQESIGAMAVSNGRYIAGLNYGSTIAADQAAVAKIQGEISMDNATIDKLAGTIGREVASQVGGLRFEFGPGTLGRLVATGNSQNARR